MKSCRGMSGDFEYFFIWLFHWWLIIWCYIWWKKLSNNGSCNRVRRPSVCDGFSLATLIKPRLLGGKPLAARTLRLVLSDKRNWIRRQVAALESSKYFPWFLFHQNFLGRQPVEKWNWTSRPVAPNALLFSSGISGLR